jgi:hypothetical protein
MVRGMLCPSMCPLREEAPAVGSPVPINQSGRSGGYAAFPDWGG